METRERAVGLTVGGVYALLVAALWAPFGPRSGMGYETTLVYLSESHSFFDGFLYSDPLRRFTQLFYQSGYQLSNVLGIDGSFLGNQLVYAGFGGAADFSPSSSCADCFRPCRSSPTWPGRS